MTSLRSSSEGPPVSPPPPPPLLPSGLAPTWSQSTQWPPESLDRASQPLLSPSARSRMLGSGGGGGSSAGVPLLGGSAAASSPAAPPAAATTAAAAQQQQQQQTSGRRAVAGSAAGGSFAAAAAARSSPIVSFRAQSQPTDSADPSEEAALLADAPTVRTTFFNPGGSGGGGAAPAPPLLKRLPARAVLPDVAVEDALSRGGGSTPLSTPLSLNSTSSVPPSSSANGVGGARAVPPLPQPTRTGGSGGVSPFAETLPAGRGNPLALSLESLGEKRATAAQAPPPPAAAEAKAAAPAAVAAAAVPPLPMAALAGKTVVIKELKNSDIDIETLRRAFAKLDVHGDGGLELFEFRCMWKAVFPHRPMDQESWKATQNMFSAIDDDASGIITFEEIIEYLERNRREELQRIRRPQTVLEWMWQMVGNNVGRGWTKDGDAQSPEERKKNFRIKMAIYAWKTVSQLLVFLQCSLLFVESEPKMQRRSGYQGSAALFALDCVCNIYFTVEFLMWVLSHPIVLSDKEAKEALENDPLKEYHRFGGSVMVYRLFDRRRVWQLMSYSHFWCELIALTSFYLYAAYGDDATAARPFQVVRMFRIMRLLRALRVITKAVSAKKHGDTSREVKRAPELGKALRKSLLSLGFLLALVFVTVTVSSALVFYAEQHQASFNFETQQWIRDINSSYVDRGMPTEFQDIEDSMWWSIVTLTTVGYGDKAPRTIPGRCVAATVMLCGLIVVSFPITILTSTFQDMEKERMEEEMRVMHCREFYEGIKVWLRDGGQVDGEAVQRAQVQASTKEAGPAGWSSSARIHRSSVAGSFAGGRAVDGGGSGSPVTVGDGDGGYADADSVSPATPRGAPYTPRGGGGGGGQFSALQMQQLTQAFAHSLGDLEARLSGQLKKLDTRIAAVEGSLNTARVNL